MKRNEFQIGDWLMMGDKPYHIATAAELLPVGLNRDYGWKHIVLTDDVLENKLGFKRDSCGSPYWDYELDNKYYILISKRSSTVGRDYSVNIDNEDFDSVGSCDVQYLHQLQQIVRLATGEELEVVL